VLPIKFVDEADEVGRLLFHLCAKCSRDHPDGGVKEDCECPHTDKQHGWISTYTSIEQEAALVEGYCVTSSIASWKIIELINNSPLRSYKMLAEKIHASGFDHGLKDEREKQQQFIDYC
jgi:hypothetical protein